MLFKDTISTCASTLGATNGGKKYDFYWMVMIFVYKRMHVNEAHWSPFGIFTAV